MLSKLLRLYSSSIGPCTLLHLFFQRRAAWLITKQDPPPFRFQRSKFVFVYPYIIKKSVLFCTLLSKKSFMVNYQTIPISFISIPDITTSSKEKFSLFIIGYLKICTILHFFRRRAIVDYIDLYELFPAFKGNPYDGLPLFLEPFRLF